MQILSKNVINAIFSALDTARLKEYPAIMCFEDFHISVVWVYHRTLSGNGIPAAEYTEVVTETVYLPPDPQDPDEYTAPTIKRAQSPSQRHRAAAILRLARGLTSARARSGIPRHSGNCHHLFFAQSPEAFTYDLDGNMTKDGRFTYTWNGENRLIKAETRNDLPLNMPRYQVEYAYDFMGRMVWKKVSIQDTTTQAWTPEKETIYTWDDFNIIAEHITTSAGSTTTYNVWGLDLSGSLQGAGGIGGLLAVIKEDGVYYPCYDANGNITEYVDSNGDIVAHYEYSPFGEIVVQSGSLADGFTFRFSTKPYCPVLGKVEFELRIYDSVTGGWINRDPIEEWGGLRLHGFCINAPINKVDMLGLSQVIIIIEDGANPRKIHPEIRDKKKPNTEKNWAGSHAHFPKDVGFSLDCSCECNTVSEPNNSGAPARRRKEFWQLNCTVTFTHGVIVLVRQYLSFFPSLETLYGHEQSHLEVPPKYVKMKLQDALKNMSDYSFETEKECERNLANRTEKLRNSINNWIKYAGNHWGDKSELKDFGAPETGATPLPPLEGTLPEILEILR